MPSDRVDREARVIRGYKVMSLGEAKGHGMIVDETTLDQLLQLATAPVKTKATHPALEGRDGFGRMVGKSTNFRREGDSVVADLQLSRAAFVAPEGNLGDYLMTLAEDDADSFGASPEVRHTKQNIPGERLPAMRLKSLMAVAIVDDPATNQGFFTCLSAGEDDMADTALETKVGELTAERDLLNGEVARLKSELATATAAQAGQAVALSAAKEEGIKAERERSENIAAVCLKACKSDQLATFLKEGTTLAAVQATVIDALCTGNKPVGEGGSEDLGGAGDENTKYKAEFAKDKTTYLSAGFDEASYIEMRRVDDGLQALSTKVA